jgi:hypothetical protein
MWDLWWTKLHWDRFFSPFFGFPLSISFHRCSPNSYHLRDEQYVRWLQQFTYVNLTPSKSINQGYCFRPSTAKHGRRDCYCNLSDCLPHVVQVTDSFSTDNVCTYPNRKNSSGVTSGFLGGQATDPLMQRILDHGLRYTNFQVVTWDRFFGAPYTWLLYAFHGLLGCSWLPVDFCFSASPFASNCVNC